METVQATPESSAGSFAGTILYMSPQALKAERPDPRDDLFSLGVTVYFMLVGRTPSVNYTPVNRQRKELKRNWDKFIAKCLAEDRSARFQNATEARLALASASKRPSPLLLAGVSGALILALAGGLLVYKFKGPIFKDKDGTGRVISKPPFDPNNTSNNSVAHGLKPQAIQFEAL